MQIERSSETKIPQAANSCDGIIKWVLISGVALLPLTVIPPAFDAYDLPKAILLYILTLIAVLSYFARSLLIGKVIIRKNPLNKPLLALPVIATIATLVSPSPFESVIGVYARHINLVTIYCLSIIGFMATQFMYQKEWLNRLIIASVTSFGLISIYGVAQNFGFDAFQRGLTAESNRSFSTFGNPVFFGGYIALMLPMLLSFFIDDEKPPVSKYIIGTLIVFGLIGAILSQTRGAWLAIIVGILAVIIMHRKRFLRGISSSATLIVFALALLLLILSIAGSNIMSDRVLSLNERIATAFDLSAGTVATRLEVWKSSVNMISVRPLAGYGPNQMYFWSPVFKTMRMARSEVNMPVDKAHNELLQTAIDGGLLNLLVLIWIVVILTITSIRSVRGGNPNRGYILAASAALIGYLVQGLSGIAVAGLLVPAYVFAGIIAGSYAAQTGREAVMGFKLKRQVELISIATLGVTILIVLSLKPIIADIYYFNGLVAKQSGQQDVAAAQLSKAVNMYPYAPQYRVELANALLEQARLANSTMLIEEAMSVLEQGLRYNKHDYNLLYSLANGYRLYASITEEIGFVGQAEMYYGLAIQKDPLSTYARRGLLGLLLIQEKYEESIDQAKTILQIDPDDYEVRYKMGQAYENIGKYGRAEIIYKELLKKHPDRNDIKKSLEALEL